MTDQHLGIQPVPVDYQTFYSILARKISIANLYIEALDATDLAISELREALKIIEHVEKMQALVQYTPSQQEPN